MADEIDSPGAARRLAGRVLDRERTRPIVCVTVPTWASAPLIDVPELERALAGAVELYVLPTEVSRELSAALPTGLDVYGGAVRLWWPAVDEEADREDHPLLFVHGRSDTSSVIERLVTALERRGVVVWERPAEGTEHPAVVTAVLPNGAELDLAGGSPAFAHRSHLSRHNLPPDRVVRVGQSVRVRAGSATPGRRRVPVSLLPFEPDPWARLVECASVGTVVPAEVTECRNIGAFARVLPEVVGLIPKGRISREYVIHPEDVLTVGERVRVRIEQIGDDEPGGRRRLTLSMVTVEPDDETVTVSVYPDGPPWLPPDEAPDGSPAAAPPPADTPTVAPPAPAPPAGAAAPTAPPAGAVGRVPAARPAVDSGDRAGGTRPPDEPPAGDRADADRSPGHGSAGDGSAGDRESDAGDSGRWEVPAQPGADPVREAADSAAPPPARYDGVAGQREIEQLTDVVARAGQTRQELRDLFEEGERELARMRGEAARIRRELERELAEVRRRILDLVESESAQLLGSTQDALDAARTEATELRARLAAAEDDRQRLLEQLRDTSRRADDRDRAAREAQEELRRERETSGVLRDHLRRLSPDEPTALREEIRAAWLASGTDDDRERFPWSEPVIGPDFPESLRRLEGVSRDRVVWVCAQVVCGRAPTIPGLEVHPLRAGEAGDAPQQARADGARAYRASLQANAPAARRLHYWRLPDGTIELARVVTHDDYSIR